MTPEGISPLTAAARQRSEHTHRRVRDALRVLDQAGACVSYTAVAAKAEVSRSWLYRQPDIRTEIDRLQHTLRPTRGHTRPSAERGRAESQQQRIETLLDTNRALRAENDKLRQQIAAMLGQQRAAAASTTFPAGSIAPCH